MSTLEELRHERGRAKQQLDEVSQAIAALPNADRSRVLMAASALAVVSKELSGGDMNVSFLALTMLVVKMNEVKLSDAVREKEREACQNN